VFQIINTGSYVTFQRGKLSFLKRLRLNPPTKQLILLIRVESCGRQFYLFNGTHLLKVTTPFQGCSTFLARVHFRRNFQAQAV